jgi:hypothetical protein
MFGGKNESQYATTMKATWNVKFLLLNGKNSSKTRENE